MFFLTLGVWLSCLRSAEVPARSLRLVVLDTSASVARLRRNLVAGYGQHLREQAQAARLLDQDFAVLRLQGDVRVLLEPKRARDLSKDPLPEAWDRLAPETQSEGQTDWKRVFQIARGLFEDQAGGHLVLVSDGQGQSIADWAPLWGLAAKGGDDRTC